MPLAGGAEPIALGTGDSCFEGGEALASKTGAGCDILTQKAHGDLLESVCEPAMAGARLRFETESEVVDALLPAAQLVALAHEDCLDTNTGECGSGLHEAVAGGAQESMVEGLHAIRDIVQGGSDEFSGGGRGGRAQVRNEVGNGEVGLVTDSGDYWQLGAGDCIGEKFGVEGREVFERSAATGDDNEVDFTGAVEICDACGYFGRCGFTLNQRGIQQHVQACMASIDDVEKVAEDSAGW